MNLRQFFISVFLDIESSVSSDYNEDYINWKKFIANKNFNKEFNGLCSFIKKNHVIKLNNEDIDELFNFISDTKVVNFYDYGDVDNKVDETTELLLNFIFYRLKRNMAF